MSNGGALLRTEHLGRVVGGKRLVDDVSLDALTCTRAASWKSRTAALPSRA